MAVSAYKGYELIVTGSEVDTWGDKLNTAVFDVIDKNLGGLVSKSLTNVNVTLTADENKNLILRLNGTLTGAVQIITTLEGMMIVENLTTGAFAVTFSNGVGTPITLPQSARSLVIADTTNGPRSAADNVPEFPSGTRMLFHQTAAPTGWTKDASGYNHALRLVGGSIGSGGSVPFTTAFASKSVAGVVGNTTLDISQIPLHGHPTSVATIGSSGGTNSTGGIALETNGYTDFGAHTGGTSATPGQQVGGSGGGGSHTHSFTGTPIDMTVQYVDVMIAQKN